MDVVAVSLGGRRPADGTRWSGKGRWSSSSRARLEWGDSEEEEMVVYVLQMTDAAGIRRKSLAWVGCSTAPLLAADAFRSNRENSPVLPWAPVEVIETDRQR